MIDKIKKTFFNRKFITFFIIGFLGYLMHQMIYLVYLKSGLYDDKYHLLSNGFAFIIVSIILYYANAKFTYKAPTSKETAWKATIVYIIKFILNEGASLGIMAILYSITDETTTLFKVVNTILPMIITVILMILQFLAFNKIFEKIQNTSNKDEDEEVTQDGE